MTQLGEPIFVLRGGYYPKFSPNAQPPTSNLNTLYNQSGSIAGISATTVRPTLNAGKTFSLLGDYIYYRGLRESQDGVLSAGGHRALYARYEAQADRYETEDIINSTAQNLNAGVISGIQAEYGKGISHTEGARTYEEESGMMGRPEGTKQLAGGQPVDVTTAQGLRYEVTYADFFKGAHHGIYGTRGTDLRNKITGRMTDGALGPIEGPKAAKDIKDYFVTRIDTVFNPAIADMRTLHKAFGGKGLIDPSTHMVDIDAVKQFRTAATGSSGSYGDIIRFNQQAIAGIKGQAITGGRRYFYSAAEDFVKKALGGFHLHVQRERGGLYHSWQLTPYEAAKVGPWVMYPIGHPRAFEFKTEQLKGEYVAGYGATLAFSDNLSNGMTTHEGALRGFGALAMHRAGVTNTNIQVNTVETGGLQAVGEGIQYRAYTDTMIAGKKLNRWIAGLLDRMRDHTSQEAQDLAGLVGETLESKEFNLISNTSGVEIDNLEHTFWAAPWVGIESFQRQVMHMPGY